MFDYPANGRGSKQKIANLFLGSAFMGHQVVNDGGNHTGGAVGGRSYHHMASGIFFIDGHGIGTQPVIKGCSFRTV